MEKKEAEKRTITIHWWNLGKRQLDFKGSYKEYLRERNIRVRRIKHPRDKTVKGYRFNISCSSSSVKLDSFNSDYVNSCTEAIILFLTTLGDKSKFIDGYNREHLINWR